MESEREALGVLLAEQLRQQMNNLAAAVQLLTPVVREKGGEQYDPYLAILQQSLYRMMRMVGNLEYLELAPEDAPLRAATLDLSGLCRELARQVAPLAELAGVRFRWEEGDGVLLLRGDGQQLRRMLLNLVANALRAAGEGGQAGMRLSARDGRAAVTVWDSGQGFDPEPGEEELLLRPGSLGVGLQVARRIASAHGGTIVFQHQEGKGTRAVVSLPLRPPEGQVLRTPAGGLDGGFSDVLVELSGVLPYRAFRPEELD